MHAGRFFGGKIRISCVAFCDLQSVDGDNIRSLECLKFQRCLVAGDTGCHSRSQLGCEVGDKMSGLGQRYQPLLWSIILLLITILPTTEVFSAMLWAVPVATSGKFFFLVFKFFA